MYSKVFPNLNNEGYAITSPQTPFYNCIAWAFEDDKKWWWPDSMRQYYWPPDVKREESINAFIECFEILGYEVCESDQFEIGYKKVALYVNNKGIPTHAARQIAIGKWTSKLGQSHDIEHTLDGLVSDNYGTVAKIFKKRV